MLPHGYFPTRLVLAFLPVPLLIHPLGPMTEWVLVRHGSTHMNRAGRFQGWSDPDLDPLGVREAQGAGRLLSEAGIQPTYVWSSDLRRALRTAEIAFPGATIRPDRRLRELGFGHWEGLTAEEISGRHGKAFDEWLRDPEGVAPPGGEDLPALRARLADWLTEVGEDASRERIALVSHGGPIRVLLAHFLALPAVWEVESSFRPAPGAVVRVGVL